MLQKHTTPMPQWFNRSLFFIPIQSMTGLEHSPEGGALSIPDYFDLWPLPVWASMIEAEQHY